MPPELHPMKTDDHPLLSRIESAETLRVFSPEELEQCAGEIRDVLCNLLAARTAHFASNLGVVELCLALHSEFDFAHDRLIWDTGHQIYPHKLVTGRYRDFSTIRTQGGLMGYPNPAESHYDLFMTGHAGCSVSTAMGLASGDMLMGEKTRRSVAVIGDGALPSGIVFEALNNAGSTGDKLTIVLNDNKMSICPRVGSLADYLDRLRCNPYYTGLKQEVVKALGKVPMFGDPAERLLAQLKEAVKAGCLGGMLFEELGIRYVGPIDGHDIGLIRKYLRMVRDMDGPVLLHVVTEKGHGYKPAEQNPVYFHTPPAFKDHDGRAVTLRSDGSPPYTNYFRDAIAVELEKDPRVTVLTAAMCQGNKLEPIREKYPRQFFDVGICESHAVAFAAGQCKAGLRPIVDIYSTFLQRSFDQIFQEVCLQKLPVTFLMDRAGLAGADGPTHHGVFDIAYLRSFPNIVLAAPGYASEVGLMLDFALHHDVSVAIRYPKASVLSLPHSPSEIRLGECELIREGHDGTILAYGAILDQALAAAELLEGELSIAVVNARFAKPIDHAMVRRAFTNGSFVITVEEAAVMCGFGTAVLESACEQGLDTRKLRRLGIPDEFIEHGSRDALLTQCGLGPNNIADTCRQCAGSQVFPL
jgi:1-deoxy-D-xylulose-5-phosphate synthase